MIGSRTSIAIYRDSRRTAVRIGLGGAHSSGSQKFEGESKGGTPVKKVSDNKWHADKASAIRPGCETCDDVSVTGADQVEIERIPLGDILLVCVHVKQAIQTIKLYLLL